MLQNIISYIYILKYFFFNKKIFKSYESDNIILLEANELYTSHIGYSYFTNVLAKKYNAKIISYFPIFKNFFKRLTNLKIFLIYKSFGVSDFLFYKKKKIKFDYNFRSRKEIINFKINDILIGDLIYDSYLKERGEPTVDPSDSKFKDYFFECLQIFYYWEKFFRKNNVKSIVLSHTTYKLAIPLRIATHLDIPGYTVGINFIYFIDKSRVTETNSKAYAQFYNELDVNKQKLALQKSDNYLRAKFDKNSGYENSAEIFQTKTPYVLDDKKYRTFGNKRKKNILIYNNKPNILITAHCFYDSPHAVSGLLFDDFYHWIDHLGKLSERTDYNWYLKKHPHSGNKKLNNIILNNFISKYPKLKILDEDINNSEIINEKIDLVLTVYGSVGYEYPYQGIPVLLAAHGSSYENYNFCLQPKTVTEYDNLILDLKNIKKKKISKDEICSYFFSKYLCNWDLLENFIDHKIKNKNKFFSPLIFDIWMKQNSTKKNEKIFKDIEKFLLSRSYNMVTNNLIDIEREHDTPLNEKVFGYGKGI